MVVQDVAPVPEYLPAGHVIQVFSLVAPGVEELVPAGHAVHVKAIASEYVPVGHCVLIPFKHCEPAGQAICAVAPVPE